MARVTGVGGIFLRSKDPERLTQWYVKHLGIRAMEGQATVLAWTETAGAETITTWSAFPEDTHYLQAASDAPQAVMINYRVDDLDTLLQQMQADGVAVDPHREDHGYGRFAWVHDCDGNRLELWQPAESESSESS